MGRTAPTSDNNTPPLPRIRRARPADATGWSRLAYDSKASWGCGEAFMEACRAELTVSGAESQGALRLCSDPRRCPLGLLHAQNGRVVRGGLGLFHGGRGDGQRARRPVVAASGSHGPALRRRVYRGRFRSERRGLLPEDGASALRRGALAQHSGVHAAAPGKGALGTGAQWPVPPRRFTLRTARRFAVPRPGAGRPPRDSRRQGRRGDRVPPGEARPA